ncbi:MAG: hypothetical protein IPO82_10435 [Betaproteobacteria bacterium]|nr:hypothetical protein [Betaproteobacteria bacterium]
MTRHTARAKPASRHQRPTWKGSQWTCSISCSRVGVTARLYSDTATLRSSSASSAASRNSSVVASGA